MWLGGGSGRHGRLKICCPSGHKGSSPFLAIDIHSHRGYYVPCEGGKGKGGKNVAFSLFEKAIRI